MKKFNWVLTNILKFDNPLKLEQVLKKGNNNFDFIRFVAAMMVIFGHAFALHPSNGLIDPLTTLIGFSFSGGIAVCIFFFISGMLITASYHNSNSPMHFIIMRFFRIWPALFICTLLTVFAAGPIVSVIGQKAYFNSPDTWMYLISNSVLKMKYNLPGVFDHNLIPNTVNGSLWTLPLEIKCYIGILLIGLVGLIRNKIWIVAVILALFASYIVFPAFLLKLAGSEGGLLFCAFFGVGVLFFYFRKYIILDYRILCLLFVLWLALRFTPLYQIGFFIFLVYSVLMAASSKTVRKINLYGDYSYGIYIYGYLTQQITAFYLPGMSSYLSMLITMPASLVLGFLSWHLLEHRALDLGKHIHINFRKLIGFFKPAKDKV